MNPTSHTANLVPLIISAIFLCSAPTTVTADNGAERLLPFKQQLMAALQEGMSHGAVSAIEVCNEQAPEIARALSDENLRLGRSSHRLRNPENTPPEWVAPLMKAWVDNPESAAPITVSLAKDRDGYIEPIRLKPQCLACHGEQISPDVKTRLSELYPNDKATGFAVDELRGVFWIEYSAD